MLPWADAVSIHIITAPLYSSSPRQYVSVLLHIIATILLCSVSHCSVQTATAEAHMLLHEFNPGYAAILSPSMRFQAHDTYRQSSE